MSAKKLGITFEEISFNTVSLTRTTKESIIKLTLDCSKNRKNKLKTGVRFFNHMLDGLASRALFNLDIEYKTTDVDSLNHVVVEDVGLSLGRAVRELIEARREKGIYERGSFRVAFDEALVQTTLAFDGRVFSFLRGEVKGTSQERVEDMLTTNLVQFFDGFAQGAGAVVSIEFLYGVDSHHTFEAAFKSFGEALNQSLQICAFRAGDTIGLKGTGMEQNL